MDGKERTVMNHACSSIIRMDRHIKFVCIVDRNGKLLLGQSRSSPSNDITDKTIDTIDSSTHITNSRIDDLFEVYFKYKNMYLFYFDYLLWVIRKCRVHLNDGENKNDSYITQSNAENQVSSYFGVSGCNNDNVKLVVTPLNVSIHTFLCVYFEPAYGIRNSANDAKEGFETLLGKIDTSIT